MRNKARPFFYVLLWVAAALLAWFPLWAQDTEHTIYLPFISGASVGAENPADEQPLQAPSAPSECAAIQQTQPRASANAFLSAATVDQVQLPAGVDGANIQQQFDLTSGEHVLLLRDESYQVVLADNTVSRPLPRQREIKLRNHIFDPLAADLPLSTASTAGMLPRVNNDVYIVQFVTQPLQAYRDAITQLGGELFLSVPEHAHLVRMDRAVLQTVCALPYVRWVGPYYAEYKVDQAIVQMELQSAAATPARYSIMLLARGAAMQEVVAAQITALGGQVDLLNPAGYRLEATLTPAQLAQVLQRGEVLFVDRWAEPEVDTDLVREIGGANYVQRVGNYQGQGVRGEVFDVGLYEQHSEFQARPPLLRSDGVDTAHGTVVYGILFGSQIGILPKAQGIFADYSSLLGNAGARYAHTAALVDPNGLYRAVFQSNSWGYPTTTEYTTYSAQMDDILFQYDIATLNSMSNSGTQEARPQAWAKNIVAVGAFRHYNNSDPGDDRWDSTASIGPAADGRIKPDLAFFYDEIRTTNNTGGYGNYSGTSVATPSTAGYFGLFFQLWADGVFAGTPGLNRDVFAARPHMTTAKAVMINSAHQYPFTGTEADMTRTHQGWGRVDIQNAYDLALNGHMPIIVDETNIINPFETHDYTFTVQANRCVARATLVYADPMGNPAARQHRINDLSLKVISPSGTSYWGNNGLLHGNWSTPGGQSNRVDTVENVFVNNAESGLWQVQVLADEIVQDGHVETGKLDADYALVVSGDCVTQAHGGAPITLVNPGAQRNTVRERVKLPIAVNGAGNSGLIYTATGLPTGLVIRRRTGIIAGKVTTVGTFNLTVQVKDANNHTDSTSFVWTIQPRASDNSPSTTAATATTAALRDQDPVHMQVETAVQIFLPDLHR